MHESSFTHKGKTFKIAINSPFDGNVFQTSDASNKYSAIVTDENNYEFCEFTVSALLAPHIEAMCDAPITEFLVNAAKNIIENRAQHE